MNLRRFLISIVIALVIFIFSFSIRSRNESLVHVEKYDENFEVHVNYYNYDDDGVEREQLIIKNNISFPIMNTVKYFLDSMTRDNINLDKKVQDDVYMTIIYHDDYYISHKSINMDHEYLSQNKIEHFHITIKPKSLIWEHLNYIIDKCHNIVQDFICYIKTFSKKK